MLFFEVGVEETVKLGEKGVKAMANLTLSDDMVIQKNNADISLPHSPIMAHRVQRRKTRAERNKLHEKVHNTTRAEKESTSEFKKHVRKVQNISVSIV